MAVVYRAAMCSTAMWRSRSSRTICRGDPDIRKRFSIESQAVAKLSHHNIVSVYDVGSDNGTDYIVMELMEGVTLKGIPAEKGHLPWRRRCFSRSRSAARWYTPIPAASSIRISSRRTLLSCGSAPPS